MIAKIIEARNAMKVTLETTYEDKVTVYEQKKVKDQITKITSMSEVEVLRDVPCKLSYSSNPKTNESSNVNTVNQVIKLFISPGVKIAPGSKLVVTKVTGEIVTYTHSGQPAIYQSHAEYVLELFERYA